MATVDLSRKGRDIKAQPTRGSGVTAPNRRSVAKPAKLARNSGGSGEGLKVEQRFCPAETNPFDTVGWEIRSATIRDESGQALFEQNDCEIPESWSQLATNVVVSKYFYGEPGTSEREKSVRQLIHRVTRTIADWGIADGYFDSAADGENFYNELSWLCLHQCGSFNSPVWFNVGLFQQYGVVGSPCTWNYNPETCQVEQPDNPYEFPQGSACFIQSVAMTTWKTSCDWRAAKRCSVQVWFSGTGTDLSTIRSRQREKLSGGGTPSGPSVVHEGLRLDRRSCQKWW
jgi:ribonucleoside-diphosphate reductase alpha chain